MRFRPRDSRAARLLLVLGGTLAGVGVVEALLHIVGYRFSPVVFVRPDNADDHRAYHMGGRDLLITTRALTVPDRELLWRTDPRASPEITADGFRGEPLPEPRRPDDRLIVALGDSNTLGPLDTEAHWPGFLQDLLRANRSPFRYQVQNGGTYGYTSFQGLRRFRQIARLRPALVYFSFGANDAQRVRTTDSAYAERMAAIPVDFRLAPPVLNLFWRVSDAWDRRSSVPRVPLYDFRQNLVAFVGEARALGIVPVLMTRPFHGPPPEAGHLVIDLPAYNQTVRDIASALQAPMFDAHAVLEDQRERFVDTIHNDRLGYRILAEGLLGQLHELGYVETTLGRSYAASVDLATASERRFELGPGLWPREAWPDGRRGRWTSGRAEITLERGGEEAVLLVDLSCERFQGESRGRIEVDGRWVGDLPPGNGRHRLRFELPRGTAPRMTVAVVVESAFRPRDLDPASTDTRVLGVFLHSVRLATVGKSTHAGP